jgi:hypothetical protein
LPQGFRAGSAPEICFSDSARGNARTLPSLAGRRLRLGSDPSSRFPSQRRHSQPCDPLENISKHKATGWQSMGSTPRSAERAVAARPLQQRPGLQPVARGAPQELDNLGQCRPVGGRAASGAGVRGTGPPIGNSAMGAGDRRAAEAGLHTPRTRPAPKDNRQAVTSLFSPRPPGAHRPWQPARQGHWQDGRHRRSVNKKDIPEWTAADTWR